MRRKLLACCTCLSIVVAGCGAPEPRVPESADALTLGKVQGEIRLGLSGAEVAEVLGSPNIVTTDAERREVWVYDKVSTERMDATTSSYGTLLIVGGSSGRSTSTSRQRTLTIIIKFDEEKRVRDFAYNYTQF